MTVGSTNMFNPYSGLSEDFMWNAYLANSQNTSQAGALNPAFTGSNLSGQPSTDCYQGSSGFSTGLKLGIAGGLGTAAGMYYFGGDKVSPISNKVFNDDILKAVEEDYVKVAEGNALENFAKAKEAEVKAKGFKNMKEFDATKKYVLASKEERAAFPKDLRKLVRKGYLSSPDLYKTEILEIDGAIANIDMEDITKKALEDARQNHLGYQTEKLANLQKQKNLIAGLAEDANAAKYEELIKSNPKAFGIDKTEAAEIEAEAKRIASSFKSRKDALSSIDKALEKQVTQVKTTRNAVNVRFASYWDDAAKELSPTAPPELAKAVKNCKFTKAGKYGAIAAGVGLVLGWLFGGKS